MEQHEHGLLYVVATPIGNLEDLTERARKVLSEVDLIAAEDTRNTRRLLAHLGISKRLIAYHDHNESGIAPRLITVLTQGQAVALVSDAGTPLVSDPGYCLVAAAWEAGIRVVPVPGPSAAVCSLSAAGLPSDRFLFLGFPPRGGAQRRAWIASVAGETGTLILYESGKRAVETLADLSSVLGEERRVVLARGAHQALRDLPERVGRCPGAAPDLRSGANPGGAGDPGGGRTGAANGGPRGAGTGPADPRRGPATDPGRCPGRPDHGRQAQPPVSAGPGARAGARRA